MPLIPALKQADLWGQPGLYCETPQLSKYVPGQEGWWSTRHHNKLRKTDLVNYYTLCSTIVFLSIIIELIEDWLNTLPNLTWLMIMPCVHTCGMSYQCLVPESTVAVGWARVGWIRIVCVWVCVWYQGSLHQQISKFLWLFKGWLYY